MKLYPELIKAYDFIDGITTVCSTEKFGKISSRNHPHIAVLIHTVTVSTEGYKQTDGRLLPRRELVGMLCTTKHGYSLDLQFV